MLPSLTELVRTYGVEPETAFELLRPVLTQLYDDVYEAPPADKPAVRINTHAHMQALHIHTSLAHACTEIIRRCQHACTLHTRTRTLIHAHAQKNRYGM